MSVEKLVLNKMDETWEEKSQMKSEGMAKEHQISQSLQIKEPNISDYSWSDLSRVRPPYFP